MNLAVKKAIIATLIKAGRQDLATIIAQAGTPVEAKLPYYAAAEKVIQGNIKDAKRGVDFVRNEMEKLHQDAVVKKLKSASEHLDAASSDIEIIKSMANP